MDLHDRPRQVVQQILDSYGSWLSSYRGYLDVAVQEVGAIWEPRFPELGDVDACVTAGDVRQRAYASLLEEWKESNAPFRVKLVAFAGLHLYTPEGRRITTRKYPQDARTNAKIPVTEPPLVLFGEDPRADPFDISVLWDLDFNAKTLRSAHLAAIDWKDLEGDKGPPILYHAELISPLAIGEVHKPRREEHKPSMVELQDDFEDWLDDGMEEAGPPDPA